MDECVDVLMYQRLLNQYHSFRQSQGRRTKAKQLLLVTSAAGFPCTNGSLRCGAKLSNQLCSSSSKVCWSCRDSSYDDACGYNLSSTLASSRDASKTARADDVVNGS